MRSVVFNMMLSSVQLSPPDNATSSSVCVTALLFPLLGIFLDEMRSIAKYFEVVLE